MRAEPQPLGGQPRLRRARLTDLDAIWEIERAVFGAEAWSREVMREELAAEYRVYLVVAGDGYGGVDGDDGAGGAADRGGAPGGAVGGADDDAGGAVLGYGGLFAPGLDGDIQTIALTPSARGRGLGRALMNGLLDEAAARRVEQIFLEVRADNPAARSLYLSLGFTEIATRSRYYQPDDVDAIVMRLVMKERK